MSDTIPVPERVRVVMAMLRKAAEMGDECPSNGVLAVAIGAETRKVAIGVIALLETMNLITVERGRNWRVVSIVGTDLRTRRPNEGRLAA